MAASVFFSYSHDDEAYRDQLEKHLALLKRQGLIETWHDRRIDAGKHIDESIDKELESADVILILVSASFLASDYCYSREMLRAIERHKKKEATVVPVIVRPCDWHSAPFGDLLATPKDGKAITKWANPDEAYTDVAEKIRALVEGSKGGQTSPTASRAKLSKPIAGAPVRSSNLRLKKTFSDLDADIFLNEAFDYIAAYFEGSLTELSERNQGVDGRFQRIDANTFVATIYRHGKKQAACSIHIGMGGFLGSSITYSNDTSARGSSFNESLSVASDDQELYLRSLGMANWSGSGQEKLSLEGGAELLWSMLIRDLQ